MPRETARADRPGTRRSRAGWVAGWLLLAAAVGCGGGILRPSQPQASEVEELKKRVVELQRKATVSEVELDRLRQEIARLEEELAAARDEAHRPEEALPPIDVGGEIEEGDLPPEALDEPLPPLRPVVPPPPPPPAPSPPPPAAVTPEAQGLYDQSYTLFHQTRYAEAEDGFRRYLELYPTTELADNAQFWIGECRYARGDYGGALAAFTTTVERFPGGNKVPDALLKAGKCLEALGDRERAAQTYREVRDRFRGSAAAAAAAERLEAMQ